MSESAVHKILKWKIAEGLKEIGYDVDVEHRTQDSVVDIYAVNKEGNRLEIEIVYTHASNKLLTVIDVRPVKHRKTWVCHWCNSVLKRRSSFCNNECRQAHRKARYVHPVDKTD